jgi:TIR domain
VPITWAHFELGALAMADLFLSYARKDVERAETVAQLLEANGLTVWWDRRMVAGDKIHEVIEEEIEKAKAVIVLWSSISVKSHWVLGEAATAHELEKLVPITIEECKLPIPYRGIHAPKVYEGKDELKQLAQMLSHKFKTAEPLSATAEPSLATKIEFTNKSSIDFLTKLASQKLAFEEEIDLGSKENLWKKYPLGAAASTLTLVAVTASLMALFFALGLPLTLASISAASLAVMFLTYQRRVKRGIDQFPYFWIIILLIVFMLVLWRYLTNLPMYPEN